MVENNRITDSTQSDHLSQAAAVLSANFGAQQSQFKDEMTLALAPEMLEDAARELRDQFAFDMLLDITSVDYWPEMQPRMFLNYQLYSTTRSSLLRLRVPLDGSALTIKTLERVYPNANWYERELWDLFGIRFDGHSDPRRIMMPEDWVGHPLRKDYPVGYEEVQFTFNGKDILVRKPRPQE